MLPIEFNDDSYLEHFWIADNIFEAKLQLNLINIVYINLSIGVDGDLFKTERGGGMWSRSCSCSCVFWNAVDLLVI